MSDHPIVAEFRVVQVDGLYYVAGEECFFGPFTRIEDARAYCVRLAAQTLEKEA
jgi:hypothetical protein